MYLLEIDPLDLGPDVKAVGLSLTDQTSEPVRGPDAALVWSRLLPAVAGDQPWALDFFSHLYRLREYCRLHDIAFREPASRCLVIPALPPKPLAALFQRFVGETFGVRAGGAVATGDAALEAGLAGRGVDAYHHAFGDYFFCAVCDFEDGSLTLLSSRLWASEVVRRVTPVLRDLPVKVRLPV